ncbi:MAG TPA: translation initiation factor [Flavobacterium sp.]|jgi:translation initiation factor 1
MAKKLSSLNDLGAFVFSTNKDFQFDADHDSAETAPPGKQRLEAHLDKKNRGGKVATVIKGFEGSEDDLKSLGKMLKTKCGVGGAVKEKEIIIQGNFRDKVIEILKAEGYNVKRVGG